MFRFNYTTQKEDLNYGGHVGNERALLFFQMARMALFDHLGYSELNIGDNIGIIQKNAFVEYNRELFQNEIIFINIIDYQPQKSFFDLYYEIYTGESKAIIGNTRMVAFDYKAKKIRRIPKDFHEKMLAFFEKN